MLAVLFLAWHLDSIFRWHHDDTMRTTVTLDKDVVRMLRDAMHRSRASFKQTLNTAVRAGLAQKNGPKVPRFIVRARAMGLRAGLDPISLNQLADDLEIDAFVEKNARPRKR
jgi:hypothetical protein